MATGMLLVTLAVAAGEHPAPVSGRELARLDAAAAEQYGSEAFEPVGAGGGGSAGAVEDDKAYMVGRPLFKVPPSSPCRAESC